MAFSPYLLQALVPDRAGRRAALRRARPPAADPADAFRPVTIRRATEDDRGALERLHALESRPPFGRVDFLVAEQDGEVLAALPLDGGPAVADPFRRSSAGLVALLRLRAEGLGGPGRPPRRLLAA